MILPRLMSLNTPLHRHRPLHLLQKTYTHKNFNQNTLYTKPRSSMESPPQEYRKNVGICLINPSKKIFAASRLDIPDTWQMPQCPTECPTGRHLEYRDLGCQLKLLIVSSAQVVLNK
ncbi:Nudix hydrolase 26 chloroplastic [Bienertia sinuspersici]